MTTQQRARLTSSLGTVEFSVISEERPDFITDVTEYPVEGGRLFSDHASFRPISISIDGIIAGYGTPEKLSNIRNWQQQRIPVSYSGRRSYRDLVIKEFRPTENVEIGDGFQFSMVLQEIKIASLQVKTVARDPAIEEIVSEQAAQTSTQVADITEQGREQPQQSKISMAFDAVKSTVSVMSVLNPFTAPLAIGRLIRNRKT